MTRRELLKILSVSPAVALVPETIVKPTAEWLPIYIRRKVLDKSDAGIHTFTFKQIEHNWAVAISLEMADEIWRHRTLDLVRMVIA